MFGLSAQVKRIEFPNRVSYVKQRQHYIPEKFGKHILAHCMAIFYCMQSNLHSYKLANNYSIFNSILYTQSKTLESRIFYHSLKSQLNIYVFKSNCKIFIKKLVLKNIFKS